MSEILLKNNYYDGQKVYIENLKKDQTFFENSVALGRKGAQGTGVIVDRPEERVVFDSDFLTPTQQGYVSVVTFDGRGVLESPVSTSDPVLGNQLFVRVSDCNIIGSFELLVTILGKTFDNQLIYEHLVFSNNYEQVTKNHFVEITNIMFQNFRGNANVTVDGRGSLNTAGRVVIGEVSSFKISKDFVVDRQVAEPDLNFRGYKTYDGAKTLETILIEAVGPSNDVDELDVNTTTTLTRTFPAGASNQLIYSQKFQMSGSTIHKVSLLLGLDAGVNWSGNLVIGIRPLLTSAKCLTDFLPDTEIEFDPDTLVLEEISVTQADLEGRGIILTSEPSVVEFVFSAAQVSQRSLSPLMDGDFYAITIRRTGDTSTGTIVLEEARNSEPAKRRLTVFQNNVWTDIEASTLWYEISTSSVKAASGSLLDDGFLVTEPKIQTLRSGLVVQNIQEGLGLENSSEGVENYVVVKKSLLFTDIESHPTTGDDIAGSAYYSPDFLVLEQNSLLDLILEDKNTVVLSRVKDNNSRNNPAIEGDLLYPGLAIGDTINIVNPTSALLNQNVVGSTIIPDISAPSYQYRITSQQVITRLLGDLNNDGIVDVLDAQRITELDGYSVYFNTTGTYSDAQHEVLLASGNLDILELLQAELDDTDGYEVSPSDLAAINDFIENGTAFPIGTSTLTFVRLTVEPILSPFSSYNQSGISTLELEVDNPNLVDSSLFDFGTGLEFEINFVPTWKSEHIEILDLRRFVTNTFTEISADNFILQPESSGKNNQVVYGDLYVKDTIKTLSGNTHPLDLESAIVELELPTGDSEGEINIFEEFILGRMRFSDGTFVDNTALFNSQVKFSTAISSHVKNLADADGYEIDFDGYSDGYGANADEAISTYIDHNTGLFRLRAFNIVENELFPELRTKITINVLLKKAGFINEDRFIDSTLVTNMLRAFSP